MSNDDPARQTESTQPKSTHEPQSWNVYFILSFVIQIALVVSLVFFAIRSNWENVFLTILVIGLTLIPTFLRREYKIVIPPEFQLIVVAFVFLSLFLGSARDFYYRFWWWDLVLHTSSGFLLGIVGFLVIFLLNQTNRIPRGLHPAFVCFFGVTFAVFMGVLWETVEFTVDRIWPKVNMQSVETGVVDTMQDLIVDMAGAIVVAVMAWVYTKTGRYSFVADGVRKFVRKNPRLFPRRKNRTDTGQAGSDSGEEKNPLSG